MIKRIPIRVRLTILTMFLLTLSCIALAYGLNRSAYKMATAIEASILMPAIPSEKEEVEQLEKIILSTTYQSQPFSSIQAIPMLVEEAKHKFSTESLLYLVLIIIGGGLFTYYISGKSLKPLKNLSSQMRNFTVHNLSEEIKLPDAKDEIWKLTVSFNEMTQKLNEAFVMQAKFSANAAHELRTPLAVMQTKVEVFQKKKEHTEEEYHSLLQVIERQSERLSDLVKNLFDLATLQEIECNQKIVILDLLEEVKGELTVPANEKKVSIHLSGDAVSFYGDYGLLYRAFYNLIENGIKYNAAHGSINVVMKKQKDTVRILISDTGIGIPEEKRKYVFEPFFCVDPSRSRKAGGAGLGLSLVKTIVEKHGGTIEVQNNEEEKGILFVIVFPLER